uniref:Synaptobrevin, longin-like domain protein n=1 Tax=Tanacetum cinerariifolium TaxID=118510 RepID=A0A699GMF1_TANCI|nr:hypothetical protein [Tanacetum cinerariifolium]
MVFNSPCCSNEELASPKANGSWVNGNWKNVIITEDTVRQALRLDDANSIDCLPNEEIFTELARMGYEKPSTKLTFYKAFFSAQWKFLIHTILQCMSAKRIAWNEFSSSMESTVICPATGRKFNFSKYIFDSHVRNVDSSSKFYMYPRFLQLIIHAQIGDLSSHTTKYSSPALTQKQAAVDVDDVVDASVPADDVADVVTHANVEPTPPSPAPPQQEVAPTPSLSPHQSSQQQPSSPPQQPQPLQTTTISMDILNNLLETCTALTKRVEHLEQDKVDQALEITKLKQRVKRLEKQNKLKVSGLKRLKKPEPAELKEVIEVVTSAKLMIEVVTIATTPITTATITAAPTIARRRKGVVIRDPEETATPSTIVHSEPKSKDKGKGILVEELKPLKKQAHIEQDETYARELEAKLNRNINWYYVIEQVKEKGKQDNAVLRYQALKRKPQTKAQARKNMMVYLKNMAGLKMDYFKVGRRGKQGTQKASKSSKEKAAKKQKYDEEVEELKKHLQILPNDDDDVYTEATPLALKVPVIDYEIHTENNKPHYKIIRVDGTHQLFLSFLILLRNFDREDLEMLWQIV